MQNRKNLGLKELIAIAIGGMVGGGIFTILGISVSMVGALAPFAIALGGFVAWLASYSYVKLGLYYKDEGSTYSFFKRTFATSSMAASFIGWCSIFGYISTIALYAYTFSSYIISGYSFADDPLIRKGVAICIVWVFAMVNIWSVKGVGKLEDIMVYSKLLILSIISIALIYFAKVDFSTFALNIQQDFQSTPLVSILIVASITFVAYEGFELVINATKEMENPDKNIPKAIYGSIVIVTLIYFIIALSAVLAIPTEALIKNQEYALAAGAQDIMGGIGRDLVVIGAILATSSAINGTLFGSSRQMARVSDDGYLPNILSKRARGIPMVAILTISTASSILIAIGGLKLILEFGSITFLLISLLIAVANFKIRDKTNSNKYVTLISILTLILGTIAILYHELLVDPLQLILIILLYLFLTVGAYVYTKQDQWSKR